MDDINSGGGASSEPPFIYTPGDGTQQGPRRELTGVEKLLMKILGDPGNSGAKILRQCGLDLDMLRSKLNGIISLGFEWTGEGGNIKEAMSMADEECRKRGDTIVRSMDLLLAMLRLKSGSVAELFRSVGLTYGSLLKVAEEMEDSEHDRDDNKGYGHHDVHEAEGEEIEDDHPAGIDPIFFEDSTDHGDENGDDDQESLDYVVNNWPHLPDEARRCILAIIHEFSSEQDDFQS